MVIPLITPDILEDPDPLMESPTLRNGRLICPYSSHISHITSWLVSKPNSGLYFEKPALIPQIRGQVK